MNNNKYTFSLVEGKPRIYPGEDWMGKINPNSAKTYTEAKAIYESRLSSGIDWVGEPRKEGEVLIEGEDFWIVYKLVKYCPVQYELVAIPNQERPAGCLYTICTYPSCDCGVNKPSKQEGGQTPGPSAPLQSGEEEEAPTRIIGEGEE